MRRLLLWRWPEGWWDLGSWLAAVCMAGPQTLVIYVGGAWARVGVPLLLLGLCWLLWSMRGMWSGLRETMSA